MTISRQNINVDGNYVAEKKTFFMCNFFAKEPHIQLSYVKDCIFKKCNLYGAEVDGTNILIRSNLMDTSYIPPEPTEKELKVRIIQLETYITDNNLPIPEVII